MFRFITGLFFMGSLLACGTSEESSQSKTHNALVGSTHFGSCWRSIETDSGPSALCEDKVASSAEALNAAKEECEAETTQSWSAMRCGAAEDRL